MDDTRRFVQDKAMEKLDRITVDPNICLGQPTLRGMRITVSVVLKMLAGASRCRTCSRRIPNWNRKTCGKP